MGIGSRLLRALALHDWLVSGYLAMLVAAVLTADPHPLRNRAAAETIALAVAAVGIIGAVRSGIVTVRPFAPLLYRMGVLGGVLGTYFVLRDLAPVVSPHALDGRLYALDLALFGGEPALWIQRFITPAATEWFSFFYLGYFPLLACYVLPIAFCVDREELIAEFATGMILIYCIGQTLYLIVPGWGPYHAFPEAFADPLPRGPWHDALMRTVAAAGSQKDIFPSLHTAGPLFMTLFAVRHRRERSSAMAWPATAFCALNIMVATMLLRWHYAIDVVCGILLALGAFAVAIRLPAWESGRRRARGAGPLWPACWREPSHGPP
jgi:membrane-associated phospholipid phosphatase